MRKEADGKETIISSEELKLYLEHYPETMDIHHGLVRFMFQVVDNSESPRTTDDNEKMEGVLRVPFDKMKDLMK